MSLLLRRPFLTGALAVSATSILLSPLSMRRPLLLDSSSAPITAKDWSFSRYEREANTPIVKSNGGLNPAAVRQISAGSITGVVTGLALSAFSKPLALLFGIFLFGAQFLESRGIHLIPYKRIQGYVTSVDLRSLVQDNVAFKLSFGLTCALTGFASFDSN